MINVLYFACYLSIFWKNRSKASNITIGDILVGNALINLLLQLAQVKFIKVDKHVI
ncbi:hypothetical protein PPBDW_I20728 [Photobacterium kishitanii]|nr:hypothetical protein PPBDW_I20728 [Photobacterium kishitanii]